MAKVTFVEPENTKPSPSNTFGGGFFAPLLDLVLLYKFNNLCALNLCNYTKFKCLHIVH